MSAVRAVRAVRAVTVRTTSRGRCGRAGTRRARVVGARATMDLRGDGDDDDDVVVRDGDDVAVGDAGEGGEGGGVSLVDVGASEASEASERETRLAREIIASESAVEVAEDDYRGNLRLFLDSADAETYDAWLPTGMFTGVTTNPAILERDGVECGVEARCRRWRETRWSLTPWMNSKCKPGERIAMRCGKMVSRWHVWIRSAWW